MLHVLQMNNLPITPSALAGTPLLSAMARKVLPLSEVFFNFFFLIFGFLYPTNNFFDNENKYFFG